MIVRPTGNETIAMLKDTALVAFTPVSAELFFQLQAVGHRTSRSFPMLVAACLWYMMLTSVLWSGSTTSSGTSPGGTAARSGPGPAAQREC